MDTYRTLPLQEADYHRNAVLRWNAEQHVHVVRCCLPFQQFDPLLTAQLSQHGSQLRTDPSKNLLASVLWHNDHVILAFPFHVGLATPIFHARSSLAPRGLP